MSTLRLLAIIEASSITGPAKNLLEFARFARAEEVETVIATFVRGSETNQFIESARNEGINVETIAEARAMDPKVLRSLRVMVERVSPNLIQTHAVKSHFLANLAGLPRIAPWVTFHHGYTWPSVKARMYNQLDRWSLPKADRVITVSAMFREELVRRGVQRAKVEVIHNAIAANWGRALGADDSRRALRTRWNIPENCPTVLIVGRLSREKDHLSLLRAVRAIVREKAIHLIIVGEGPERQAIESAIREMDLVRNVTLTGQQPSAEPFYAIADLAVLASRSEGSPNALLEAMASEIPTVATTVGGIPEIVVDGESALLVPPGDANALASAMRRVLLDDPSLGARLSARARQLVLERHTPQQRVRKLVGIYRSVIDGKPAFVGKATR